MDKNKICLVENGYHIDVVVLSEDSANNPKLLGRFLPLDHLNDRLQSLSTVGYLHLSAKHVPSIIREENYTKAPLGEVIPMYPDDVLYFSFNSLMLYIRMKEAEPHD